MAARVGGYYGAAFKGERGVTQGDPLSPTLFNLVVDAVVRHWLDGLQAEKDEKDAEGGEGHFSAFFYADDGMVGATDPKWLQGAFSALVAIFDRVGLQTNVNKTVIMACQTCRAGSGNRTAEGYRRRITGEGKSFRERQRERESGVRGVRGGNRVRIPVESLDDSTRDGRTTAAPLAPPRQLGAPGYTR